MKKIFTVLLAVALTTAVSAQSIVKKGNPTAPKKAKTELTESMIKNVKPAVLPTKHQATKDADATVDALTAFNFGSMGGNGSWEFLFAMGNDLVFDAPVVGTSDNQIAGIYTLDTAYWVDGNDTLAVTGTLGLTYVADNGDGTYTYVVDAEVYELADTTNYYDIDSDTITVTAIDYLYYIYYQYGMVDLEDCLIELYDAPLPTEYDTLSVSFTASQVSLTDFTASQGVFQFIGEGDTTVYFAVNSSSIAGEYDSADIYYQYTSIWDANTSERIGNVYKAEALISATDGGYELYAEMWTRNGLLIYLTMPYNFPVAEDTIVINDLTDITLNDYADYDGSYQFIGYNDDQSNIVALNYYSTSITGSFTMDDCDASYSGLYYEGEQDVIYSGSFTVTEVDGGYNVAGHLLCTSNHVYQFSMTYLLPYAEDTVTVTYTNATLTDYSTEQGICQFIGANADSSDLAYIAYNCTTVAGSYTDADLLSDYTAIVFDGEQIGIVSGNFNVVELDGGYQLHGYFLCEDNHCYELYISTTTGTQGISNVQVARVNVYPNPFTNKLNVQAEGVQEIQVIDMMGQVVARQQNAGTIDMSAMANGAYIVRTVTANGVSVQKVIKK